MTKKKNGEKRSLTIAELREMDGSHLSGTEKHMPRLAKTKEVVKEMLESYADSLESPNELDYDQKRGLDAFRKFNTASLSITPTGGIELQNIDQKGYKTVVATVEDGSTKIQYADWSKQKNAEEFETTYPVPENVNEIIEKVPEIRGQMFGKLLTRYAKQADTEEGRKRIFEVGSEIAQRTDIQVGGGVGAGGKKRLISIGGKYDFTQVDIEPGSITIKTPKGEETYKFKEKEE